MSTTPLKVIVLSDDQNTTEKLKTFCLQSDTAKVVRVFDKSKEFLESVPLTDFDYCIADADIKDTDGIALVQMLHTKPYIIVTDGEGNRLKEAINLSPIDVVLKPVMKEKLDKALTKAFKLLGKERKHGLFRVAESDNKVPLRIEEMMLITTDQVDPRNKEVYMKGGKKYTLMNYSMDDLLGLSALFIQINKSSVVNIEAVHEVAYDMAILKHNNSELPKYIIIGIPYRARVLEKIFYKCK